MQRDRYSYRVERTRARRGHRWRLAIVRPDGSSSFLTNYATRATALETARLFAGPRVAIEVRS